MTRTTLVGTVAMLTGLFPGATAAYFLLPSLSAVPAEPSAYLDAEYDFLGALATWPAAAGSATDGPFPETTDAALLAAGRTVCLRAGDPGMTFDGITDLLELNPHQTYVVMAEAASKLCPSSAPTIAAIM